MKQMKKDRLRQLVLWGYITQPQANQMWRDYLRGVIPIGKIPQINWQYSIRIRVTESQRRRNGMFIALPTDGK